MRGTLWNYFAGCKHPLPISANPYQVPIRVTISFFWGRPRNLSTNSTIRFNLRREEEFGSTHCLAELFRSPFWCIPKIYVSTYDKILSSRWCSKAKTTDLNSLYTRGNHSNFLCMRSSIHTSSFGHSFRGTANFRGEVFTYFEAMNTSIVVGTFCIKRPTNTSDSFHHSHSILSLSRGYTQLVI